MRNWLIGIIVIIVVGAVAFVALSRPAQSPPSNSSNSSQNTTQQTQADNSQATAAESVHIQDYTFMPQNLTVKKGTKVTWTNEDSVRHNVVSESDSPQKGLNGPLLAKGESYSFTFDTVGTYKYYCTPHASMSSMHATVTVTE